MLVITIFICLSKVCFFLACKFLNTLMWVRIYAVDLALTIYRSNHNEFNPSIMDAKSFIKKEYNNWEEKNYADKCRSGFLLLLKLRMLKILLCVKIIIWNRHLIPLFSKQWEFNHILGILWLHEMKSAPEI